VWLPGAAEPVVAGRLEAVGDLIEFNYGRSFLARGEAIPLYLPELPLQPGRQVPLDGLRIAGCIKDVGPDAWGQRVIMRHLLGDAADDADPAVLDPLTYLLRSGSDRIGALDFQESPAKYVSRNDATARLEQLLDAADLVDRRLPLPPALALSLLHGSSVGGARPKALLQDGDRKLIAKFASSSDTFPVVPGEFVAMELARRAGLDVAPVQIVKSLGRVGAGRRLAGALEAHR
jgi:serine/threonine-protein kinase HipA